MNIFILICFSLLLECIAAEYFPLILNFNKDCLRCICHAASGCDFTLGCVKGYCGPFKISRVFWIDAGNVTLPGDEPERTGGGVYITQPYEDCTIHYDCAERIIINYLIKFARDCNDDGVTNCDDYAMIHFNGGIQCDPPVERNEFGRIYSRRYKMCSAKAKLR